MYIAYDCCNIYGVSTESCKIVTFTVGYDRIFRSWNSRIPKPWVNIEFFIEPKQFFVAHEHGFSRFLTTPKIIMNAWLLKKEFFFSQANQNRSLEAPALQLTVPANTFSFFNSIVIVPSICIFAEFAINLSKRVMAVLFS